MMLLVVVSGRVKRWMRKVQDSRRPDLVGLVPALELARQPLVEGERAGLCAAVIDILRNDGEAGHAGNGDDVAVVGAHHCGEELADEQEVGDDVDVKGAADVLLGGVEDGAAEADAGVVDEDGRVAVRGADGGGDGGDVGGFGHVEGVEVRV